MSHIVQASGNLGIPANMSAMSELWLERPEANDVLGKAENGAQQTQR